jgi:hypothetical protein
LLVARLVLGVLNVVEDAIDVADGDTEILAEVDAAIDVLESLDCVDEESCVVVVLEACELVLFWLLLPAVPVPHPPPPPLAGGVQRKFVAA